MKNETDCKGENGMDRGGKGASALAREAKSTTQEWKVQRSKNEARVVRLKKSARQIGTASGRKEKKQQKKVLIN